MNYLNYSKDSILKRKKALKSCSCVGNIPYFLTWSTCFSLNSIDVMYDLNVKPVVKNPIP